LGTEAARKDEDMVLGEKERELMQNDPIDQGLLIYFASDEAVGDVKVIEDEAYINERHRLSVAWVG
jgi:hypothetical protein